MRFWNLFGGYKPLGGQSRLSLLSFSSSPCIVIGLVFTFLYLLGILYSYSHFYRDPTSAFWDPARGYDKAYSLRREQEAEAFIDANHANTSTPRIQRPAPTAPSMCLGIATIARPKIQYIHKTVGSVLDGMNETERASLHFIFFIAHTDPHVHPIFGESWTENLPDTLLAYDHSDEKQIQQIQEWERSGNHREKGFYDYIYLLKACEKTGAPYIAMLEGDVLAVPGWLGRSIAAAEQVDGQAGSTTSKNGKPSWLYIRMFWTETYLGWNSEEWPTYTFWSAVVWAVLVAGLLGLRILSPKARGMLPNSAIILLACVCLPLCIILYFAAGRMTVQPPQTGVRRMENYGCCSQGMVFSVQQVPTIIDAIEKRIEGYMDMLLETLASRERLARWAIFPSLLQHIGGESSKGDPVADARARMIWNFAFERYGQILEKGRSLWKT